MKNRYPSSSFLNYVLIFFSFLCLMSYSNNTMATHASGAELSYSCVGPNQYQLNLIGFAYLEMLSKHSHNMVAMQKQGSITCC